jgi:C-terminal processing protease CtpA/Prc
MKIFNKLVLFTWLSVLAVLPAKSYSESPLGAEEPVNFIQLVEEINNVMFEHHYNIRELKGEGYQSVLLSMKELAAKTTSKQEFIAGFKDIWKNGPFSHVVIGSNKGTAKQVATYLDAMNVGEQGAQLSWQLDIAVLTINTMMGQDTIERIRAHYQTIAEKNAKALIIDLRSNEGGAFAIKPLVSHLIKKPLNAGYFVAQKWSSRHKRLPTKHELAELEPWSGWSILAFWRDVQDQALIKVQFEPANLHIDVPVYILTSGKTASASELATDALQSAGRVTVIGEKTVGQMLSQKPFDLPNGLQLYVPIADYYSINTGRLEGNPIQPDIETTAAKAMQVALSLASKAE